MRLVLTQAPVLNPGEFLPPIFDVLFDPLKPVIRVGRHGTNEIVLPDTSVSRQHAEMEVRAEGLLVRDLGSSNGTFINQQRLEPNKGVVARIGDKLQFGNIGFGVEPDISATLTAVPTFPRPPAQLEQSQTPQEVRYPQPVQYGAFPPPPPPPPNYYGQPIPGQNNPPPPQRLTPNPRSSRNSRALVFGLFAGLLIIAALLLAFFLLQPSKTGSPGGNSNSVSLPPASAASPSGNENIFGVTFSHPKSWKRGAANENVAVTFFAPEAPTTGVTLEKPPGTIITDPGLSPEKAINQYLENVRSNSASFQNLLGPGPTRLSDGTEAFYARVVFTPKAPNTLQLKDYTNNALAFRCKNILYIATAGADGKLYNGATQQDLEAAIASFRC